MMRSIRLMTMWMVVALAAGAHAETVHQTLPGAKAHAPDGGSAVDKNLLEVKDDAKAQSGSIARAKGELPQWGFVAYWFGIPTPAGASTLRLRIYVDGEAAQFNVYIMPAGGGQVMVGKIQVPADAKPGAFVDVNIAVDAKAEWSGAAVKKAEKSDKPGPWIDSISVILP